MITERMQQFAGVEKRQVLSEAPREYPMPGEWKSLHRFGLDGAEYSDDRKMKQIMVAEIVKALSEFTKNIRNIANIKFYEGSSFTINFPVFSPKHELDGSLDQIERAVKQLKTDSIKAAKTITKILNKKKFEIFYHVDWEENHSYIEMLFF